MSMIDYQVYAPYHWEDLRKLFERVWGSSRSVEYDQKHWNNTIIGTAPGIVALAGDRIVGFYTVWPVPLTDGAKVVIGGQPIDSMVDGQFQGRGLLRELGRRCYQECARHSIAVMYGAPNRAALAGNLGGLNWSHVSEIVDYVRPVLRQARRSGFLANLMDQDRAIKGLTVSATPSALDTAAVFYANVAAQGDAKKVWRLAQSTEWVRYRYGSTPEVRYLTLMIGQGDKIRGAAVCGIRFKNALDGPVVKLTISELVGRDNAACREVIGGIVSLAAACGAPYVQAKSAGAGLGSVLLSAGFLPYRRTPLISRTLDASCHRANPLAKSGWALFGGAFDTI
ncbi:GNAT family N-acetyltransferase [Rhodomicrobium vannielii ATCC 17100]|uniref:GNAT family N-acetyltransferase n=1 Tax=Rhodomicrobium vannielii TaxID=1069 RepID=UPI00191992CB|nr:GNAT family N-acetyltransferase [Rhodomicrobium vannielii]MBJ7533228.1 GNAT family N-acetyltransferase [Rhodomicrobium vannielii ATCC 17100]